MSSSGYMQYKTYDLIMFDGDCHLCNNAVHFIIKWDPTRKYKFTSRNSHLGQSILRKNPALLAIDSVVLISNGEILIKAKAVKLIVSELGFPISIKLISRFIPTLLLNVLYDLVAKSRFLIFGREKSCRVYPAGTNSLFINDPSDMSEIFAKNS